MLRIAVLVSGGGTNLQALIDAGSGTLGGEISLVVSNRRDAFALERARAAGIDTAVLPGKGVGDEEYSSRLSALLKPHSPDLIVLAGFLRVLSEDFCREYENRIINVHPSLIPSFCGEGMYGLRVHEAALARGVKVTGATVHFVSGETDGGPIILQKAVKVLPTDTPEELQKRVMREAEHILLPRAVSLFCRGKISVCAGIAAAEEEEI